LAGRAESRLAPESRGPVQTKLEWRNAFSKGGSHVGRLSRHGSLHGHVSRSADGSSSGNCPSRRLFLRFSAAWHSRQCDDSWHRNCRMHISARVRVHVVHLRHMHGSRSVNRLDKSVPAVAFSTASRPTELARSSDGARRCGHGPQEIEIDRTEMEACRLG
jgi:hypothetical protein